MNNWNEEFRELMFPVNEEFVKYGYSIQRFIGRDKLKPSEAEIKKALLLKHENFPKSLFKYRAFDKNDYWKSNLERNELWLSNASKFNDPFDSVLISKTDSFFEDEAQRIELMKNDDKIDPKILKSYQEAFSYMQENKEIMYEKNKTNSYIHNVGSLSETNQSILMWSHYSENHEGMCIEYAIDELSNDDIISISLYPVFYQNVDKDTPEDKTNGIKLYKTFAVLRKRQEWNYEKEWRIIFPAIEGNKVIMPRIKSVYLGCKINNKNLQEVMRISKAKGFDIYKSQIKSDGTGLNFNLIKNCL